MNEIVFLDSLGEIDAALVEEAAKPPRRRRIWPAAAAACLCAALAAALIIGAALNGRKGILTPGPEAFSAGGDAKLKWHFFKYGGRIYEGYESFALSEDFRGEKAASIERFAFEPPIVSGDVPELSGSLEGDVYRVKGIEPELMLCAEYEGELIVFTAGADRRLRRGSEVFGDEMHIKGNAVGVSYESQRSLNAKANEVFELFGHEDELNAFLDALNGGEWVYEDSIDPASYRWWNIYITLSGGYRAHLVWYRGGYVGLYGIRKALVKIDEDKASAFIELLEINAPDRKR